jgi:hypothetical protein
MKPRPSQRGFIVRNVMKEMIPSEFHLSQNYPNPFSERTTIKFCVPCKSRVRVDIVNAESGFVRRLEDDEKEAGTFEIELDACGMAEGSYLCVLQAGDFAATKRMTLKRRS